MVHGICYTFWLLLFLLFSFWATLEPINTLYTVIPHKTLLILTILVRVAAYTALIMDTLKLVTHRLILHMLTKLLVTCLAPQSIHQTANNVSVLKNRNHSF